MTRFRAMKQRCDTDTHVSSHNYKGRGIRVEFFSAEEFVAWARSTWPNEDFKGKDFDRINNDGNYMKENLRLVSRSVNHLNRRDSATSIRSRVDDFTAKHPEVTYQNVTLRNLFQQGLTEDQILARHEKCPPPDKRKPKSKNFNRDGWHSTAEIYSRSGLVQPVEHSPSQKISNISTSPQKTS